jgi:hypothetical protein
VYNNDFSCIIWRKHAFDLDINTEIGYPSFL